MIGPKRSIHASLQFQCDVNAIMIGRGRGSPVLSRDELHALDEAYHMGHTAEAFAATLPDRRPDAGLSLVED